ncbi:uncharacterized protein pdzph1 isoform X2 [Stigmatopora argus]
MSKRGRRRHSRRRRSSSRSKQTFYSVPFISYKLDKSAGGKHEGAGEYLPKEKVGSYDVDEDDKRDNAPPREKRRKRDYHVSLFQDQSSHTLKTEKTEVKIVTSVSVDNFKDAPVKITFQHSREPFDEHLPVTNIININCVGPRINLQVREIAPQTSSGVNTTIVLINEEKNLDQSQDDSPRNAANGSLSGLNDTLSPRKDSTKNHGIRATPSPSDDRARNDELSRTKKVFRKSYSSDHLWNIPPTSTSLEGLVSDLASCNIASETRTKRFEPESGNAFYDGVQEHVETSPLFDDSSFSDRSHLTKDFLDCPTGKSHARPNSVEDGNASFPPRRRQTFPGVSVSPKWRRDHHLASYGGSCSLGNGSPMSLMKSGGIPNIPRRRSLLVAAAVRRLGEKRNGDDFVDQSEVTDSGFDQEMGEVECSSPKAPIAMGINVIPPSRSASEDRIGQSQTAFSSQKCRGENLPVSASSGFLVDSRSRAAICTQDQIQWSNAQHATLSLPLEIDKTRDLADKRTRSLEVFASNQRAADGQEHFEGPEKPSTSRSSLEIKDHLKVASLKDGESSPHDSWARRRKLFKDSKQWSSAGGSSFTSDIAEESVSEDIPSMDLTIPDHENEGFYAETFHSVAWLYQKEKEVPASSPSGLKARSPLVSIRERTVKVDKGLGEYPWGFRIQYAKPIVVTEVDTNGAAEEAGLAVGDYVLAVNGTDVTSISHSEAAQLARQGPEELTLTVGSDIGRAPNVPRPACRGYLHKRTQSGLIKGWRKRWFVLTPDAWLCYYKHKRDEGKCQAVAALKMEGAEVGPDLSLGKAFALKCQPASAERTYYLCATSGQEMKRWLEAMERAIHPIIQHHVWEDVTRHNWALPPLAVKNPECLGLLHKMDKSKDSKDAWVQHYSILKDACLYLYSGIRATRARGYMVREQHFASKKSTIELKPPSDEFKTFYFCAENPNENKRWITALKASIKKWLPLRQALQDYMGGPPEATRM